MFISSKLLAVLTLKQKSKALSITHSLMFSAVASTFSISFSSDQNPDRVSMAVCLCCAQDYLLYLFPLKEKIEPSPWFSLSLTLFSRVLGYDNLQPLQIETQIEFWQPLAFVVHKVISSLCLFLFCLAFRYLVLWRSPPLFPLKEKIEPSLVLSFSNSLFSCSWLR
jgi:Ca2+/Na+ antiporter